MIIKTINVARFFLFLNGFIERFQFGMYHPGHKRGNAIPFNIGMSL